MANTTKKRILIAEDEKPLANALGLKLTSSGFEPVIVNNGREALETIEKGNISLILLDLIMPEVDGFEVLEEMQKNGNKTPVIVLSNLGQEEDIKKAKAFGAKDFFIKSDTPIVDVVAKVKSSL